MRLQTVLICLTAYAVLILVQVDESTSAKGKSRRLQRKFSRPSAHAKEARERSDALRRKQGGQGGGQPIGTDCLEQYTCTPSKFRTIDGSCNNYKRNFWGATDVPFRRLLPARYDGNDTTNVLNDPQLPNPRLVSANIIQPATVSSPVLALITMQFGQFLDHDITSTPTEDPPGLGCCDEISEKCAPVSISETDPFYGNFNHSCMEFSRSIQVHAINRKGQCLGGTHEQLNQITTFIDGSNVYGSDLQFSLTLYNLSTGFMHTQGDDLLPQFGSELCGQRVCFSAGDDRSNEQPGLTTLHTIFVNEHNRIAQKIKDVNGSLPGETVYQETRRIIGAILQFIVYEQYLPAILGTALMNKYKLESGAGGQYKQNVDPRISNAFATAAYRFGHSQLQDSLSVVGGSQPSLLLSEVFFDPFVLHNEPDSIGKMTRGLLQDQAQKVDARMTTEVTQLLFKGDAMFGLDLASLNIQRGRDHALPAYGDFRSNFNLGNPAGSLTTTQINLLKQFYNDEMSADLFVGGLMEQHAPGARMGPTFGNIIGEQFNRLKFGDYYFYKWRMSHDEIHEIEKMTLANVLCKVALADADTVHQNVFLRSGTSKRCDAMADIDVSKFL